MTTGQVRVFFLSGNDHEDDPAWGHSPIRTGSVKEIIGWLLEQPTLTGLTVETDGVNTMWAEDFVKHAG